MNKKTWLIVIVLVFICWVPTAMGLPVEYVATSYEAEAIVMTTGDNLEAYEKKTQPYPPSVIVNAIYDGSLGRGTAVATYGGLVLGASTSADNTAEQDNEYIMSDARISAFYEIAATTTELQIQFDYYMFIKAEGTSNEASLYAGAEVYYQLNDITDGTTVETWKAEDSELVSGVELMERETSLSYYDVITIIPTHEYELYIGPSGVTSKSTYHGWTQAGAAIRNLSVQSQPVPEPATMLLLGSGLIGLVAFRKKFRKS